MRGWRQINQTLQVPLARSLAGWLAISLGYIPRPWRWSPTGSAIQSAAAKLGSAAAAFRQITSSQQLVCVHVRGYRLPALPAASRRPRDASRPILAARWGHASGLLASCTCVATGRRPGATRSLLDRSIGRQHLRAELIIIIIAMLAGQAEPNRANPSRFESTWLTGSPAAVQG